MQEPLIHTAQPVPWHRTVSVYSQAGLIRVLVSVLFVLSVIGMPCMCCGAIVAMCHGNFTDWEFLTGTPIDVAADWLTVYYYRLWAQYDAELEQAAEPEHDEMV